MKTSLPSSYRNSTVVWDFQEFCACCCGVFGYNLGDGWVFSFFFTMQLCLGLSVLVDPRFGSILWQLYGKIACCSSACMFL